MESTFNIHKILTKWCMTIAFLSVTTTAALAEQKQALTLQMRQGGEIVYFLESMPLVTFSGQEMIITTLDNSSRQIQMGDVERWVVSMREYALADDLSIDTGLRIAISSREVRISNPSGGIVAVYSTDGRCIDSAGGNILSFTLPKGVYIITATGQSYKIIIR